MAGMVVEKPGPTTASGDGGGLRLSHAQYTFVSWLVDILVYIVVLNLFVEWVPTIIIDSFTISIFTAIVLRLLVVAITGFEHRVSGWFAQREGTVWKALRIAAIFAILFFSKFVVLEVIDIVFGDTVELGQFIEVAILVVTLILVRLGVKLTYERLATVDYPRSREGGA